MKIKLLALLLCLALVLSCFAGCTQDTPDDGTATGDTTSQGSEKPQDEPDPVPAPKEDRLPQVSGDQIRMYYDDRLAVSELGDGAVEITDQKPVSKKVGTDTADDAVVYYDETGKTLIAVGIGTAKVTIGGTAYQLSVEAAPISLFMITGHSIGAGQAGNAAQSILCNAGQAYSSHGTKLSPREPEGLGIGYGSQKKPDGIDAFTTLGAGTQGEGSGIAYKWNELTGEKVWILNTAVGGSCLPQWTPGQTYFVSAVKVFQYAQEVLAGEIKAGHYRLKDMAIIYHSAANFGYNNNYGTYTQNELKAWYDAMWNGFKQRLAKDMDGDGKKEELSALGFVPIWTVSSVTEYKHDKPANYYMGSSKEYPDMFMASLITKEWINSGGFPDINYTTVKDPVVKPTATSQLFADGTHLTQVVYNAQGMDIALNLYNHLREVEQNVTVTFEKGVVSTPVKELTLRVGESVSLVPLVSPITVDDLTYTVSDNLSISYPMVITAKAAGTGTLTVSQRGKVITTLAVTIR